MSEAVALVLSLYNAFTKSLSTSTIKHHHHPHYEGHAHHHAKLLLCRTKMQTHKIKKYKIGFKTRRYIHSSKCVYLTVLRIIPFYLCSICSAEIHKNCNRKSCRSKITISLKPLLLCQLFNTLTLNYHITTR